MQNCSISIKWIFRYHLRGTTGATMLNTTIRLSLSLVLEEAMWAMHTFVYHKQRFWSRRRYRLQHDLNGNGKYEIIITRTGDNFQGQNTLSGLVHTVLKENGGGYVRQLTIINDSSSAQGIGSDGPILKTTTTMGKWSFTTRFS